LLGTPEIIALAVLVVLVFFGHDKVIQWARALGQAKSEFAKGKENAEDLGEELEEDE